MKKLVFLTTALLGLICHSAFAEVINFPDGSVYDGEIKDGKRHGQGKFTFSDGEVYIGQYDNDQRTQGTLTFPNGDIYQGTFKNGVIEGKWFL
jgi:hypothetical protein